MRIRKERYSDLYILEDDGIVIKSGLTAEEAVKLAEEYLKKKQERNDL